MAGLFLAIPAIILVARIVETSLETVRTVYITRGHTYLASSIGVGKVAVWLLSTGLVLTNLTNIPSIVAYIAGYGIGTVAGMEIEDRISLGNVVVRIISPRDPEPLVEHVCRLGYGITRLAGSGRSTSQVSVLLMVVPRKELGQLLAVLQRDYPDLLFTVEDIRILHDHGPIYFGKGMKQG
ncbi:MAG TPA: DUF5698 domain-containing protein [Methanomicrobiales archaeon]|nr:DUF5698 domain-containing protein [Methanomicrobiales archaeon]